MPKKAGEDYKDSVFEKGVESFCRSNICEGAKLVIGSAAVFLLILVAFVGVALTYCVLKIFPLANFALLFIALVLLAYIEALHYGCVAVSIRYQLLKQLLTVNHPSIHVAHHTLPTLHALKIFLFC